MKSGECGGFTLIELLVVLALLAILAGIVAPVSGSAVTRAKESALKEDLYVLRKAIDDYYADKGEYPPALETIVEERYVRAIPRDPITGEANWMPIPDENGEGVLDVRSTASGSDREGVPYAEY